jgi:penicillin-insensitive murein endopeptidase
MTTSIVSSVGAGGVNKPEDVGTVQSLLNAVFISKIKVDKRCGSETIQAISEFQKTFLPAPDGRVDPGGITWTRLLKVATGFVQLTQVSGLGYYTYSPMDRQFGTSHTVKTLKDIVRTFAFNMPSVLIGIGDISFAHGGQMLPHATHQHGTNVDIRPLRKDNHHSPISIADSQYSAGNTRVLVASLLAHHNVKRILFNDTSIPGVHYFAGHDNHLHVEMKL